MFICIEWQETLPDFIITATQFGDG